MQTSNTQEQPTLVPTTSTTFGGSSSMPTNPTPAWYAAFAVAFTFLGAFLTALLKFISDNRTIKVSEARDLREEAKGLRADWAAAQAEINSIKSYYDNRLDAVEAKATAAESKADTEKIAREKCEKRLDVLEAAERKRGPIR